MDCFVASLLAMTTVTGILQRDAFALASPDQRRDAARRPMAKLKLHQSISVDGYVTQHHFLRGQDARELERRVGYGAGRLKDGFYLLFLNRVPKPDEFELRGYSHLPGGKPVGATDDAEAHLKAGHF